MMKSLSLLVMALALCLGTARANPRGHRENHSRHGSHGYRGCIHGGYYNRGYYNRGYYPYGGAVIVSPYTYGPVVRSQPYFHSGYTGVRPGYYRDYQVAPRYPTYSRPYIRSGFGIRFGR